MTSVIVFVSCEAPSQGSSPPIENTGVSLPNELGDSIALFIGLINDTVRVGSPIRLWAVMVNGGDPYEIDNRPGALLFWVEQQGVEIPPIDAVSMDDHLGRQSEIVLPNRSAFGQLVDLKCVNFVYGEPESREPCYYGYSLGPGHYEVIGRFHVVSRLDGSVLVFADTANLVVRR